MKKSLLLCALLLAALMAFGAAAEAPTYRTSAYFTDDYTAYGSAIPGEGDQYLVEVFLQLLPGRSGQKIVSYALYINEEKAADVVDVQRGMGAVPLCFAATVPVPTDVKAMTLVPVTESGKEMTDEALDLMRKPAEGSPVGSVGVVNNPNPEDRLNLRIGPSSSAESLRHYYNGVAVNILNECADGWVAVSIGSDGGMARGYMKKDFLATGDEAAKVKSMIPSEEAAVASWTLYSFPDEAFGKVGDYAGGQKFEILGQSTAWWHIRVGDKTGFVHANVLIEPEVAETPAEQTPLPAEGGEAQATLPPAQPVTGEARQYQVEKEITAGYVVKALVRETAQGQFSVDVNVQLPKDSKEDIQAYALVVNGLRLLEVPQSFTMHTAEGPALGFTGEMALDGTIMSLRLVPLDAAGKANETAAIDFPM